MIVQIIIPIQVLYVNAGNSIYILYSIRFSDKMYKRNSAPERLLFAVVRVKASKGEVNDQMNNNLDAVRNAAILIPSLEPDERLPEYIRQLSESGFGRIVVVDDGSGEGYQPVFDEVASIGRAVVLHHDVNHGKGVALKTGYRYIMENLPDVTGVITADADGQHTVSDCIRLAEKLTEGEHAVYLGSRDFGLPDIPPKSRTGNRITSTVFKLLYGVWLPDTQTGLRAFRREDLPFMMNVAGERYEYEMRVLIACATSGIPMIPITIETIYENGNEGTHFHPIRDSYRIYKVILGGFFRFMSASLICFVVDQLLAFALREWLLPAAGFAVGSLVNTHISGYGARLCSSLLNFQLNRRFVFRLRGSAKKAIWRYFVLCILIITVSNMCVWLLGKIGMVGWLAKMIVDTLLYFLSYRVQRQWVFREEG